MGIYMDSDIPLSNGQSLRDAVDNGWKEADEVASPSGYVNSAPSDDEPSETESMRQELLMQEIVDVLPLPHRADGYDFFHANISILDMQGLEEVLPQFEEASREAQKMVTAIKLQIRRLDEEQMANITPPTPEPEPIENTVRSVFFTFAGRRYEVDLEDVKTLASLRGKIGNILNVAPKDIRIFTGNDEITRSGGTFCKTVGIVANSEFRVEVRGRGGARGTKATVKDRANKHKTNLGNIAQGIDRSTLSGVGGMDGLEARLDAFVVSVEADAEQAILQHCANMSPDTINLMYDMAFGKGGTNEGRIDDISLHFFGLGSMKATRDNIDKVLDLAGSALNLAVANLGATGLVGFKKVMERVKFIKMGQALGGSSATGSAPSDAHMT